MNKKVVKDLLIAIPIGLIFGIGIVGAIVAIFIFFES